MKSPYENHYSDFSDFSDFTSLLTVAEEEVEQCVQERFWFPAQIVEGLFWQLSCGCIAQGKSFPDNGTVQYCAYCNSLRSIRFSAQWRTIYNNMFTLYEGPLAYRMYVLLREKLSLYPPIVGTF